MFVKIHSKKKTEGGPEGSHAHAPEERARLKQSLLRNTINTKKKEVKQCFHYEVTLMSANPLSPNEQP